MTPPPLFASGRRLVWFGLAALALAQAIALVGGVAGTRLAFASLENGDVSALALGLIGGAACVLAGLRPGMRLLAERLGQDQTIAIREALFQHAMDTTPDQLARRRRGYLMLRLTGDMTVLKDGISRSLPPVLQAAALVPAATLALALIDPRYGLVGALLAGLCLAACVVSKAKLHRAHKDLRSTRARLVADMAERLPVAPDLARMGRRRAEVARLAKAGRALHRQSAARLIRAEGLRAVPGCLVGLCATAVLWDGARRGIPSGEIAAVLAALGVMGHALVELAGALDRFSGWSTARETLTRHLAEPAAGDRTPKSDQVSLGRASGRFMVTAEPGLMTPLRLDLAPGAKGMITGPDSDGLLLVLSGQAAHPAMSVLLDGIEIGRLTPGSIRRNVGVLSRAPLLLKGSVRRNICLGLTDRPTDETLIKRLEKAGLVFSLARLGGLDGSVPESGRALASSDRLLLSACRVAVQRPKVLIVGADALPLPDDVAAYVARSDATVVELSHGAVSGAGVYQDQTFCPDSQREDR